MDYGSHAPYTTMDAYDLEYFIGDLVAAGRRIDDGDVAGDAQVRLSFSLHGNILGMNEVKTLLLNTNVMYVCCVFFL